MARIGIALGPRSYDILIEPGALDALPDHLGPFTKGKRTLWVTDSAVAALYGDRITSQWRSAGVNIAVHILPAGEASKSWSELERLVDWLLDQGVERGDAIVAFGGGMVGDITGFAASIVKRGCDFVQVPTTLLAQVDSSVGGKTAINTRTGKNLVGSFHQPRHVLIDPMVLNTLPDREMRAGYAEVIKYGLIDDPGFFAWCEANGGRVLARDPEALSYAITTSVTAKARIVGEDERETKDRRALLNLGHTFGHALEAETGFGDRLLHGEAVATGMALAFRYSARTKLCSSDDAARVTTHLEASGLPATLVQAGVQASGAALVDHMRHDKKMVGGTLSFLLARGIGQTFVSRDTVLTDVEAFLNEEAAR